MLRVRVLEHELVEVVVLSRAILRAVRARARQGRRIEGEGERSTVEASVSVLHLDPVGVGRDEAHVVAIELLARLLSSQQRRAGQDGLVVSSDRPEAAQVRPRAPGCLESEDGARERRTRSQGQAS